MSPDFDPAVETAVQTAVQTASGPVTRPAGTRPLRLKLLARLALPVGLSLAALLAQGPIFQVMTSRVGRHVGLAESTLLAVMTTALRRRGRGASAWPRSRIGRPRSLHGRVGGVPAAGVRGAARAFMGALVMSASASLCLRLAFQDDKSKGELRFFGKRREVELLKPVGQRFRPKHKNGPQLFDRPLYIDNLRPQKHLAQAGHR
jgi:hypothetical protein